MLVNLEHTVTEQTETYPDHCQEGADRAKCGSSRWDTRELLPEIQDLDGRVY